MGSLMVKVIFKKLKRDIVKYRSVFFLTNSNNDIKYFIYIDLF